MWRFFHNYEPQKLVDMRCRAGRRATSFVVYHEDVAAKAGIRVNFLDFVLDCAHFFREYPICD